MTHVLMHWLWGLSSTVWLSNAPLSVDDCVQQALHSNASIAGAQAKIATYQARLAELKAVYWPKINGLVLAAPMYTVRGDGYARNFTRRYEHWSDWGPYTSIEMTVVQPLYTFGRAEAGSTASQELVEVEEARCTSVQQDIALEVRRLYYTHLFAASMLVTLRQAISTLEEAQARGQALYEQGTGAVSQIDLAKLAYGMSEAARFKLLTEDGAQLTLVALRHVMGLPMQASLQLQETAMPAEESSEWLSDAQGARLKVEDVSLPMLLQTAQQQRPEWAQLNHGEKAARAWESAEQRGYLPVLFVAAQARYGYAPTRDTDDNPWHFDNYNTITGGIALGLKFDLDPVLTLAKVDQARAQQAEVAALRRQALTGIALQVRKAYDEVQRARKNAQVSHTGLLATRKWMVSATNAYQSNVGEARDLLEGLAAYVQAKRAMLESLQAYHLAAAELKYAIGS